jgi:hypothetical protein
MSMHKALALAWPVVLATTGCIIDTVPTPEDNLNGNGGPPPTASDAPYGSLVLSDVYYALYQGSSAILIAGAPGAVPGHGSVGVQNPRTSGWVQRQSLADGSFSLSIDARVGDTLRLMYYQLDASQKAVVLAQDYLTVRPSSTDAVTASVDLSTSASPGAGGVVGVTASAVDAVSGLSTVVGLPGVVPPGIVVVVVNPSGGASAVAAGLNGSFSTTIAAKHLDLLVIFAVEPAVSQAGGPTATISVP